ncbi:MAG: glycosyl hydrolase [Vicinamibacteria bacterium]
MPSLSALGLLLLSPAAASATAPPVPSAIVETLDWRNIGPSRGGRVVAVTGVPGQPLVYYFGGTGGGVFKTTDAGASWTPMTDGQIGTGSVGALAVAPSDPNVVYAGMGEACVRGNVSHGDGVYRSTDAGRTWTHAGLRETEQIGRMQVDPRDPDRVYVAALGHTFGPNKERGVFRSKDGGKSWQQVLFVDENTGAVDLSMDATNPRVLYAGLWQVRRSPWGFDSGGPGSSLWKSTDGGDTWRRLTGEGLPSKGVWGRVGVAVSPARPDRGWAVVEAEDGGVFRSDDAGRTWRRVNEDRRLRQRAWYYTHVYADPANADTMYVLNVQFFRSQDGGKTFTAVPTPHSDNHDLWIAPEDPRRMVQGNDGGANVSFDGGATWSRQDNQPTAQFYHAITDDRFPYHVYGAQQDNSTVAIASRTSGAGIGPSDWYDVGGCESGYIAPKPGDPDIVFAGCYGGSISRYDRRTDQLRNVTVWPDNPMGHGAEGMKHRFQWTFPIVVSRHGSHPLYAAGNRVFRSTDEGGSWTAVSPDLTRNDASKLGPTGGPVTKDNTSVEYYGTVFAFAESPLDAGVLWAGSDDGLVHVSRDAGATWTNVTPKDLPEWSMVSQLDPSPHAPGTLYLAANRYKLDDRRPFLYATTDYGRNWRRISDGLPAGAFTRVVRQDPVRPELLFAGTELGVYVSQDAGARWQPLRMALPGTVRPDAKDDETRGRLPIVPITDLVVKGDDLVAATQGRSFWILDDIAPLRTAAPDLAGRDAFLWKPSPAYRFGGPPGPRGAGRNPAYGATIRYWLKAEPKEAEEVALEIVDAAGTVVRRVSIKGDGEEETPPAGDDDGPPGPPAVRKLPAKAGLNRFVWDLRHTDAARFKGLVLWASNTRGPRAVPGRYEVRLTAGGRTLTEPFEVKGDPRLAATPEELAAQLALSLRIRDTLTETHQAITRLRAVRDQLTETLRRAKQKGGDEKVRAAGEALGARLTKIEEALYQTKNQSSQDPLNYPIRLNNKLAALGSVVGSGDQAPTAQAGEVFAEVSARIRAELDALSSALSTDLPAFNALASEERVPAVTVPSPRP